jgi:hypothetical protein
MAGTKGIMRDERPKAKRAPKRDRAAEERLAELERALEEAVAAAVAAKDTPELLRLHAHFLARVRAPLRADPADGESASPASDAAAAAFA